MVEKPPTAVVQAQYTETNQTTVCSVAPETSLWIEYTLLDYTSSETSNLGRILNHIEPTVHMAS